MKKFKLVVWFIILVYLMGSGCAPRAVPTSAPVTPATTPVLSPEAPKAVPTPGTEEVAWQKVVEAAKKEGKPTVYSFFLIGDIGTNVKKAFEERTGLGVDVITGTGAQFIERIKAERRGKSQTADILDSSVTNLFTAKAVGLTAPAGYLPALADKATWERNPRVDPEGTILGFGTNIQSPWVNTTKIKPGEEPHSWRELLHPKWKKRINMGSPDSTPAVMRVYYALTKYAGFDDAYFRNLAQQVVVVGNIRLSGDSLARGETDVTFTTSSTSMATYIAEGVPVKAIDMEEGVVDTLAFGLSLLDGAPRPNSARVFANWFLSNEGQSVFHKYSGTNSLRKDVPEFLPRAAQIKPKRTIFITPEDDQTVGKLQVDRVLSKLMAEK